MMDLLGKYHLVLADPVRYISAGVEENVETGLTCT